MTKDRRRNAEWTAISGGSVSTDDYEWHEEWLEAKGAYYRIAFQGWDTHPAYARSEDVHAGDYGKHRARQMTRLLVKTGREHWAEEVRKREERRRRGIVTEPDLKGLFSRLEESVAKSSTWPREAFFKALEWAENEKDYRSIEDWRAYELLMAVVFYSGVRAALVDSKYKAIHGYLGDAERAATFTEEDIARYMNDRAVLRHEKKLLAAVHNARVFCQLVTEHGSFARYLDSLGGDTFRIRDDLRRRFRYLGPRTVLHFMMNLWFPVLKPDLAVCRILTRLGFIESPRNEEDQIDQALRAGMRIAHAVGKPIRYVDAILVMYGQVSYKKMGIEKGVCLLKPRCEACGVKVSCLFPAGLAR